MNRFLAGIVVHAVLAATASAQVDECRRGLFTAEPLVAIRDPRSAVWGDFDRDTLMDVAIATETGVNLVYLNRGAGVFEPISRSFLLLRGSLFTAPLQATTDVNRDGKLDLVYRHGNTIGVRFGRGDGTFGDIVDTLTVGSKWHTTQINGAFAFVDMESGHLRVLESSADGTFHETAVMTLTTRGFGRSTFTLGDFDGDGELDAAGVAADVSLNRTYISFAWSFATTHAEETTSILYDETLPSEFIGADLDGDGISGLIAANPGQLLVLTVEERAPNFERRPRGDLIATSDSFKVLGFADVDKDGRRDFIYQNRSTVGIWWGDAEHAFAQTSHFELPGAFFMTLADINGDSVMDVAPSGGREALTVLYGARNSRDLPAAVVSTTPVIPWAGAAADVNEDGRVDVVIGGQGPSVAVMLGSGDGRFVHSATYPVGPRNDPAMPDLYVGDFDGDGHVDAALSGPLLVAVLFGDGAGRFGAPVPLPLNTLIAAFPREGKASQLFGTFGDDVQLIAFAGRKPETSTVYRRPPNARLHVADVDDDRDADLIVMEQMQSRVVYNNGTNWAAHTLEGSQTLLDGVIARDLNGDGSTDLTFWGSGHYSMWLGNGDGGFVWDREGEGLSSHELAAEDFDSDGLPDLIGVDRVSAPGQTSITVMRNLGGGHFEPHTSADAGPVAARRLVFADADGDGRRDILAMTFGGIEFLRNVCASPTVRLALTPSVVYEGQSASLAVSVVPARSGSVGVVTIFHNSEQIQAGQPGWSLPNVTWTTPPLTAGTHTFRVSYLDQFSGEAEQTIVVNVLEEGVRSRRVRRP